MTRTAMIVWGGWAGHDPDLCASIIRGWLRSEGFDVRVETKTEVFLDPDIKGYSLIIPIYTMSKIEKPEALALCDAVKGGSVSPAITAACATPSATPSTTNLCAEANGSPIRGTSSTTRST